MADIFFVLQLDSMIGAPRMGEDKEFPDTLPSIGKGTGCQAQLPGIFDHVRLWRMKGLGGADGAEGLLKNWLNMNLQQRSFL